MLIEFKGNPLDTTGGNITKDRRSKLLRVTQRDADHGQQSTSIIHLLIFWEVFKKCKMSKTDYQIASRV